MWYTDKNLYFVEIESFSKDGIQLVKELKIDGEKQAEGLSERAMSDFLERPQTGPI